MIKKQEMTDKDKKLLELADHIESTEWLSWYKIDMMADEAESEEAKQLLHDKATRLHHREEWYAETL